MRFKHEFSHRMDLLKRAGMFAVTVIPLVLVSCEKSSDPGNPVAPAPGSTVTLVGAGDIADDGGQAEATATLLDAIPGTVFTWSTAVPASVGCWPIGIRAAAISPATRQAAARCN